MIRTPHPLLDTLIAEQGLKNDAALARALGTTPVAISKIRNRVLPVTAASILAIHEATGKPVADIRQLIAEAA